MNNTIIMLYNSVIRVFDDKEKMISQAVIIEIPVEGEQNKVRPYLIFPLIDGVNTGYLLFKLKNGSTHKVSFDEEFIISNNNNGFIIYPIAGLINSLLKNNLSIDYSGIPSTICINEQNKDTINEIEEMNVYSWNETISKLTNTTCIYSTRNITPILSSPLSDYFILSSNNDIKVGSPVFIINNGGYFANNTIYMGNRVIFMGVVEKIESNYLFVKKSNAIFSFISQKFESKIQKKNQE